MSYQSLLFDPTGIGGLFLRGFELLQVVNDADGNCIGHGVSAWHAIDCLCALCLSKEEKPHQIALCMATIKSCPLRSIPNHKSNYFSQVQGLDLGSNCF